MEDKDNIEQLIIKHQRRLQKLKEKQAELGINTPPEVLIQIEDIEAEILRLQEKKEGIAEPKFQKPKMYDVFLHHCNVDTSWVIKLKDDLLRYGVEVWLDIDEIRHDEHYYDALNKVLGNCRTGILIISPEAVQLGWVYQEYYHLRSVMEEKGNNQVELIPVLLREVEVPGFLKSLRWVRFLKKDKDSYNRGVWELVCEIIKQKPEFLDLSAPEVGSYQQVRRKARQAKHLIQIYLADDDFLSLMDRLGPALAEIGLNPERIERYRKC